MSRHPDFLNLIRRNVIKILHLHGHLRYLSRLHGVAGGTGTDPETLQERPSPAGRWSHCLRANRSVSGINYLVPDIPEIDFTYVGSLESGRRIFYTPG